MTTPICPKCGSIKVEKGKQYKCKESDCNHIGQRKSFMKGGPGTPRTCNTHWRDPVAMSMDGYED